MKIAVSQREEAIGQSGQVYDCLAQAWYTFLQKHTIVPVPNVDIDQDYDFDVVFFSGGNSSLTRLHTELKLYNWAIKNNVPMVGICHGAFFLCELTGGTCGDIEGHRGTEHVVRMDNHNIIVNSFHGSNIITVGKDYDIIATDLDGNVEGFKHKTKPIWGLVWHPELMEVPILPKDLDDFLGITKNVLNHIPDYI